MKKSFLWLLFTVIIILEVVFMILIKELTAIGGYGILDSMIYNSDKAYEVISSYTSEGITLYKQIQLLDFIFPLIYGMLLFGLLYQPKSKLIWIPILASVMDYSENLCIRAMLTAYPKELGIGTLSFIFTVFKFLLIFISVVLIIYKRVKLKKREYI